MESAVLTTTEAAGLLGVSRQHVADLADRGTIPSWRTGTHRRFHRADVITYRSRLQPVTGQADRLRSMTLTDRRSLGYGLLVAAKLVSQPERVTAMATANLDRLRAAHPDGSADFYLNRWAALIEGPVELVLHVLTSTDPASVDLRHASPFAGVLSDEERIGIIQATRSAA